MRCGARLLALACICLLLSGCTPHTDHLAVLSGSFLAQVQGEWNGVCFSATAARDAGGVLTVTFYAPEGLSGAVLEIDEAGAVILHAGELAVKAEGLAPIARALSPTGEVDRVEVDDLGHTVVGGTRDGVDFSLTLLENGTPIGVTYGELSMTVISFEREE